jgi:hypothetical protein
MSIQTGQIIVALIGTVLCLWGGIIAIALNAQGYSE